MYKDIRNALSFDANKNDAFLEDIYAGLPVSLKMDLILCVNKSAIGRCEFLSNLGNRYYITWISSQLKPRLSTPSQRLYSKDDEIDDFFFMVKGVAAFTNNNSIIGLIDPQRLVKNSAKMKSFKVFGCEDSVINHLWVLLECEYNNNSTKIQKAGENALNQRYFTVESLTDAEYLTLNVTVLDKMKKNFQAPSRKFYKKLINQT